MFRIRFSWVYTSAYGHRSIQSIDEVQEGTIRENHEQELRGAGTSSPPSPPSSSSSSSECDARGQLRTHQLLVLADGFSHPHAPSPPIRSLRITGLPQKYCSLGSARRKKRETPPQIASLAHLPLKTVERAAALRRLLRTLKQGHFHRRRRLVSRPSLFSELGLTVALQKPERCRIVNMTTVSSTVSCRPKTLSPNETLL